MLGEKLPPHDLAAETAVIGSIILDGDSLVKISGFLSPSDFFNKAHSVCYQSCIDMLDKGIAIDEKTLGDFLETSDSLNEIEGGRSYLTYLVSQTPTYMHIEFYARTVHRTATHRRLITAASDIANLGYENSQDVDQALNQAEDILYGIRSTHDSRDFVDISVPLDSWLTFDDENDSDIAPIPSGFPDLDNLLGGLNRSDMIVLAARPSIGKSTLGLNIARNVAGGGHKVAIFSLEMGRDQIAMRLLSSEALIETNRIRQRFTTDTEDGRILEAIGRLSDLDISIDDTPFQTVTEMRAKAKRLQKERGLDFIVVDYMQLIYGGRNMSDNNRAQEVSKISRALKGMARDLNVPVIAISQLSRSIEQRQSHRPVLSDLRESGSIEQDADIVAFIHREEKYITEEEWLRSRSAGEAYPRGISELIIAKHRNGPIGNIDLVVQDQYARFRSIKKQSAN
ncbi:MAG: replicative DNA helicase [Dehalococcoidia bacterium]|nr:replicative DNA helicase [Dehalococcoidia bacterium]MEC7920676.1 replicative DNA helicase [Chloroflexota bacterium]MQG04722.1 replicative DNA helicase [SAR202 cluster bacterium]